MERQRKTTGWRLWATRLEATGYNITRTSPYGSVFDDAHYEVLGRMLNLHYTVYPADAAESAVLVFIQAP